MEFIWTGLGSLMAGDWRLKAYSSLWMFLIYGLGVLLEPIHDAVRRWPWVLRGLIWMTIIFVAEYSSGWFLRGIFGAAPWKYTNSLAVNGLVRLDYAPCWFIVGLGFEQLHDYLVHRFRI